MSECQGCARVAQAASHPDLIAELPASWLLLGEHQAYPHYAVLWSKQHAKELHHLPPAGYAAFMDDLRRASSAVEAASQCWKLNVVSLGNVVQHVHLHLFPRSSMDPDRTMHPWVHAGDFEHTGTPQQRQAAIARIREALG
jgi:diadenosine tetraphosphate (Ap4A) HIT family hydrolase